MDALCQRLGLGGVESQGWDLTGICPATQSSGRIAELTEVSRLAVEVTRSSSSREAARFIPGHMSTHKILEVWYSGRSRGSGEGQRHKLLANLKPSRVEDGKAVASPLH